MGAKTGILAFWDGDLVGRLRRRPVADAGLTRALVERILPGYRVEPIDGCPLDEATYPPDDIMYALSVPGLDIACDQRLMHLQPSELPGHLLRLGDGRHGALHAMHSVSDYLTYATWAGGVLTRSLSLSPDGGIVENIGEPLPFEATYWAGEHPVEHVPGWPVEGPYPLPFHPLDLGEDALRHLYGFILEGRHLDDDVPAREIGLLGFRVTDPTGAEQARREATYREALAKMGRPRTFRYTADGTLVEITPTR
ncbi:hypothetical protein OHA72_17335 [Dactylosporangium sp. NBC_01737]|uniref:DUF6928 family protein n=1 Tax=Dactylosporangium sp. NBC_01737 TaxID=2975959 RepID=UPI002E10D3F6|nr:hypothetical protein OHA72_17335 [Dactylosporangium sp. NBC_01737]